MYMSIANHVESATNLIDRRSKRVKPTTRHPSRLRGHEDERSHDH